MPRYNEIGPKAYSIDNLLLDLQDIFGKVFLFYFFGALGLYLFLRYLKLPPIAAFAGALIFMLLPQFKGLWIEGHFRKFRAIMFIPWVGFTAKYFVDRRSLFSALLFALAFGIQIRTGHYQIVFYTALFAFAIGIYPLIQDLIKKKYLFTLKSVALLLLALVLGLGMAAQPLLLNKEYLPYSKRGKTTIDLSAKQEKTNDENFEGTGVSLDYAIQWSTHPSELLRWIIPHAYGGIDGEIYSGEEYPQLAGQKLPNYWGHMPFHGLFDYMGLITFLLAVIGIVFFGKDKFILSISFFMLFLVLLSFGRHLEWFYSIFYYYFPYFNKFRVPSMSVSMSYFIVSILAGYGLKYLLESSVEELKKSKKLFYIIGGIAAVGVFVFLASSGFEYVKEGENYNQQIKTILSDIRQNYLTDDLVRYFILLIIFGGFLTAYLNKKVTANVLGIIVILIIGFDLVSVSKLYSNDFIDEENIKQAYFQQNLVEQKLASDDDLFRIFPIGQLLNNNRWAYSNQSIGGYSAIKMYTVEELVQNCYYGFPDKNFPINLNIAKMMNVKYFIATQQLAHPKLKLIEQDSQNKLFAYKFADFTSRAYFVDTAIVIEDSYKRLEKLNDPLFDPTETAIVEEDIGEIYSPDSSLVNVVDYNPNKLTLNVYTDKKALLVISEMHYPPAWHAYIDKKEALVYRANHALQSVIVEPGNHTIELVCHPDSYFFYKNISIASVSLIYLILLGQLSIYYYRVKFRK
jgi:hypothetical protein